MCIIEVLPRGGRRHLFSGEAGATSSRGQRPTELPEQPNLELARVGTELMSWNILGWDNRRAKEQEKYVLKEVPYPCRDDRSSWGPTAHPHRVNVPLVSGELCRGME